MKNSVVVRRAAGCAQGPSRASSCSRAEQPEPRGSALGLACTLGMAAGVLGLPRLPSGAVLCTCKVSLTGRGLGVVDVPVPTAQQRGLSPPHGHPRPLSQWLSAAPTVGSVCRGLASTALVLYLASWLSILLRGVAVPLLCAVSGQQLFTHPVLFLFFRVHLVICVCHFT